jgi:hypothetical protein
VEPDTRKRVAATRVDLETSLPTEANEAARYWVESTNLQEIIDQILSE